MSLPSRVHVSNVTFLFWVVLDTLIALAVGFGPCIGLWFLLAPESFLTRLVATIVCGFLFCFTGFGAALLWMYIISETTGL